MGLFSATQAVRKINQHCIPGPCVDLASCLEYRSTPESWQNCLWASTVITGHWGFLPDCPLSDSRRLEAKAEIISWIIKCLGFFFFEGDKVSILMRLTSIIYNFFWESFTKALGAYRDMSLYSWSQYQFISWVRVAVSGLKSSSIHSFINELIM